MRKKKHITHTPKQFGTWSRKKQQIDAIFGYSEVKKKTIKVLFLALSFAREVTAENEPMNLPSVHQTVLE